MMASSDTPGHGKLPELPDNVRNFLRIDESRKMDLNCAICHDPIETHYFLDPFGTIICHKHTPQYCCLCGRIITFEPIALPGYGYVCEDCGRETSYREIEEIRKLINDFYHKLHIFIPGYHLRLLSPDRMIEEYNMQNGRFPLGAARKIAGTSEYRIDLMYRQSKICMGNTLAHELLHLWQYHRGIKAPVVYAEGFCNLGAFLFTATVDKDQALVHLSRMMENRDRTYGMAFRQLKIIYDIYGLPIVISAMKSFKEER